MIPIESRIRSFDHGSGDLKPPATVLNMSNSPPKPRRHQRHSLKRAPVHISGKPEGHGSHRRTVVMGQNLISLCPPTVKPCYHNIDRNSKENHRLELDGTGHALRRRLNRTLKSTRDRMSSCRSSKDHTSIRIYILTLRRKTRGIPATMDFVGSSPLHIPYTLRHLLCTIIGSLWS